MKNLLMILAMAMVFFVGCRETEVPVDEMKTNVKFSITTENIELKSMNADGVNLKAAPLTTTTPFFVKDVFVEAFRNGAINSYNSETFDVQTSGPFEMLGVILGQNTFHAENDMTGCVEALESGSMYTGKWVNTEYKTCLEISDILRGIKPWMPFVCDETVVINANHNTPIDMDMETNHGRLIVTVEMADENNGLNALVTFKNPNFGTAKHVSASVNRHALGCKKGFLYWSDKNAVDGQEVELDIFVNENGNTHGAPLKQWTNYTHPKLKIEAGVDRWVNIKLGGEFPLVEDVEFKFSWTYVEDDFEIPL